MEYFVLLVLLFDAALYVRGLSATCHSCSSTCVATTVELSSTKSCRCDEECTQYGDCCSDKPLCGNDSVVNSPLRGLECRKTENIFLETVPRLGGVGVSQAYWMVSACPDDWLTVTDAQRGEIYSKCAGNVSLPPVSDRDTGIVYKNEYCAVCNGVQDVAPWRYELGCTKWLDKQLRRASKGYVEFELDLEIIHRECLVCGYEPPQHLSTASKARACYPHITTCHRPNDVDMNYEHAVEQCASGPFDPVWNELSEAVYRNRYCAVCNNESMTTCAPEPFQGIPSFCPNEVEELLGNQTRPPSVFIRNDTAGIKGFPLSMVLDVDGSGLKVSYATDTVSLPVFCDKNQLYDPAIRECRWTVCPEVFTNGSGGCTFPTNTSCPTGLIELTENDNFKLLDNTSLLYSDAVYDIVDYLEGNPVICANRTATRNITERLHTFPESYFILTYIGCSISLVGVTIILLTLALFKELRTMTTIILSNLSVSIIFTNVFILAGGPIAEATHSNPLCVSVGILLHFSILAEFSWMTILCVQITDTLIRGAHLQAPHSLMANYRRFVIYFLAGWGAPIVIVVIAVAVNFTPSTSHLVLYGRLEDGTDGLCWINHKISAILGFIVPVVLSLLANIIQLVIIGVILTRAIKHQVGAGRSSPYVYVRVFIVVFFSSGAMWIFGILAMVALRDWAWYPFVILNSIQGLLLFVAFMATRKVVVLYLHLFSCGKLDYRASLTRNTTRISHSSSNSSSHIRILKPRAKEETGTVVRGSITYPDTNSV